MNIGQKAFSIFHFDLYRLKFPGEVDNLGFEEIWGKTGIIHLLNGGRLQPTILMIQLSK